jgi:hypothetical protein
MSSQATAAGPQKAEYQDLGGGINEGVAASGIADNEMVLIENFYPFGKKLIRRNGSERQTTSASAELITGIINYRKDEDSPVVTIVGTLTGLSKLDAGAITPLVSISGTVASDDHPWTLLQYNTVGYALRKNGGLRRFTAEVFSPAGITRPSAAPVLAQGAAGQITAATWRGVVTFYNTETGAESNPSDESNALALAANRQIDWSGIPISSDYQVNARRLYRTLPDQQGQYLFVAQIDNNVDTVYTDDVAVGDLGDFVSFDNDPPPANLEAGDSFNERGFYTDGVDLFFTEPFSFEAVAADSVIRISPDDGHRMSAVHTDGTRLIVGKTNKVYALSGTDRSNFAVEVISDRHGIYSHHSVKSAEGQLLWYGGNSFYRIYGGGQPESIATVKLKRTLARIPTSRREYVVSAIYPKYGWYLSAVTLDSGDENNAILCYNYKADSWCVFTFAEGDAPAAFGEVYDEDLTQIIFTSHYDGHLNQFDEGNTDAGSAITAKFRTGGKRVNQAGLLTALRRFFIHCTQVSATAKFRSYRNDDTVHYKERTISLNWAEALKAFDLSGLRRPASFWSFEMEYSGAAPIEVEGLALEMVPVSRMVRSR